MFPLSWRRPGPVHISANADRGWERDHPRVSGDPTTSLSDLKINCFGFYMAAALAIAALP